jgi:PAS domain-containing protein
LSVEKDAEHCHGDITIQRPEGEVGLPPGLSQTSNDPVHLAVHDERQQIDRESIRRAALLPYWSLLQNAAACPTNKEADILECAIAKLTFYGKKIRELERQQLDLLDHCDRSSAVPSRSQLGPIQASVDLVRQGQDLSSGVFSFLNYIPSAFLTLAGNISSCNPAFLRLFAYTVIEAQSLSIFHLLLPADRDGMLERLHTLYTSGGSYFEANYLCSNSRREISWLHVLMACAKENDGMSKYFVVVFSLKETTAPLNQNSRRN